MKGLIIIGMFVSISFGDYIKLVDIDSGEFEYIEETKVYEYENENETTEDYEVEHEYDNNDINWYKVQF